jgi:YD repeat-containing protein
MRLILFILVFFSLIAKAQYRSGSTSFELSEPAQMYKDLPTFEINRVKGNVKHLHSVEYKEISTRQYDSVVQAKYFSGNIATQTMYSRYGQYINLIYHYRDTSVLQIDSVYRMNGTGQPYLISALKYNRYGPEEITSFENGRVERSYSYTYNDKGQLTEEKCTKGRSVEYDYQYTYNYLNKKDKEIHLTTGDGIIFIYDNKGNKAQEIYTSSNGLKTERTILYTYDEDDNLTGLQVVLGGGNLARDQYKYNALRQKIERLNFDQLGYVDTKQTFTYDELGNLKDEVTMRPAYQSEIWLNGQQQPTKKVERTGSNMANSIYSYNTAGQLLRVENTGNLIAQQDRNPTDYIYDAAGNLVEMKTASVRTKYSINKACGKPAESWSYYENYNYAAVSCKYKYDKECRLIQKEEYRVYEHLDYGPARSNDTIITSYKYDSHDKLADELCRSAKGDTLYMLQLAYNRNTISAAHFRQPNAWQDLRYSFSNTGELTEMRSSNPYEATEVSTYTYEYDPQGNWTKRSGVKNDKNGKIKQEIAERTLSSE